MIKNHRKKLAWIIMVLSLVGLTWSTVVDDISLEHTDTALKRALLTFAVARALNGVISVAQGTELAIHPAGFGVNFTPGEVLDPLNDLIEQFSWVMLASAVSLGIQKTMLHLSSSIFASVVLTVLLVVSVTVYLKQTAINPQLLSALKISLMFMLFVRFSVPIVVLAGNAIYQGLLAEDYENSRHVLEATQINLVEIKEKDLTYQKNQTNQSMVDKARQIISSAVEVVDVEARLEQYKQAAAEATEHAVRLMVVFILQTVLLPLVFLWLCYRVFDWLARISLIPIPEIRGTVAKGASPK